MTCKFCGQQKKLCKAHIWPDGLKDLLFKESINFVSASVSTGKGKNIQTLEFDKTILCADCDRRLGVFDQTFIELLKEYFQHPDRNTKKTSRPVHAVLRFKVNTQRLKLALAALLLRMSYSDRVNAVKLGNTYEAMFKIWLEDGEIPVHEAGRLEAVTVGYLKDANDFDRLIVLQPYTGTYGGSHYYFLEMVFGLTMVVKVGQGQWMENIGKYPKITHFPDALEVPLCDPDKALSMEHITKMHRNMKKLAQEKET